MAFVKILVELFSHGYVAELCTFLQKMSIPAKLYSRSLINTDTCPGPSLAQNLEIHIDKSGVKLSVSSKGTFSLHTTSLWDDCVLRCLPIVT